MRSLVILAASFACVHAGLLEQPASASGWNQQTSPQSWQQKTAVEGQILPEHEKEISIIKQQLGMKEGISLTLSGPSHLVQTVHKVRTIDQGGKILLKTRDFTFENDKDKPVIVEQVPLIQRPLEAARFLTFDGVPQPLKYPLTSGAHEHIMLPSVQKEISVSRVYDASSAPQVRKYFMAPQAYRLAVVKQIPGGITVPQLFKQNPQVSFPPVNNNFVVPQAIATSPIPQFHKNIVVSANHKVTLLPKVHPEHLTSTLSEHSGRLFHNGLAVPHMNNRPIMHQAHKHGWAPQIHNFAMPARFHGLKWH